MGKAVRHLTPLALRVMQKPLHCILLLGSPPHPCILGASRGFVQLLPRLLASCPARGSGLRSLREKEKKKKRNLCR